MSAFIRSGSVMNFNDSPLQSFHDFGHDKSIHRLFVIPVKHHGNVWTCRDRYHWQFKGILLTLLDDFLFIDTWVAELGPGIAQTHEKSITVFLARKAVIDFSCVGAIPGQL